MNRSDELRRQIEALQERVSRLSAAVLRISVSLDLDTVLQEVVDSGCALTGAQYGVITTGDEAGRVQEFVTSGFTPEEQEQMVAWTDGPRLFAHFRELDAPLRLTDLPTYVRALGFSSDLMRSKTLQVTPIRHGDDYVGNFFLAGKEGGREFTSGDEEMLVLFASQAAAAIANARTHRDERRARADLETLIETSPVGVVVFDGRTGKPVSINREVRRVVQALDMTSQSPEELLRMINCRRADGREVNLAEFPLAQQLSGGETVRGEEMTLTVPSGRSVTMLVNSTPIQAADGAVESVVVTLQDLAPLDELERSRAEFLSLVSHELRTPLAAIKGSAATVLDASPAPSLAEVLQFFRIIEQQADHMRGLISDLLDAGHIKAGTLSVTTEPAEVANLVEQARKTFQSGGGQHTLLIDLPPDLPRVLADRLRIVQVLNNLFSNASRHSSEAFPIRVSAVQDGVYVAISVSDEGQGIPPEQLPHLFRKDVRVGGGEGVTRGAGLGLAICKGLVEAHGGRIRADSGGAGLGARFTFTIPVAEETDSPVTIGFARGSSRSPEKGQGGTRILVMDDDPLTLRFVRDALSAAGYSPLVTGDPQELPRLIKTKKPELVLLDLVLPETDGIELMESLPELADLPVIFISAYGRDDTIARALEMGAADYIVKPFSARELTARVHAALRKLAATPKPFHLEDLEIDYEIRRVTVAGRTVQLTPLEYELLRTLSINAGRVTTYDSLIRQVWSGREYASARLVRTFVKNLRRKLGDHANVPTYIHNVHGVGYRLVAEDDQ
ncbi:MAG: response regulator [Acidobacteriota bacterium]|nr:response regulator [Acidobacteriota bacterium]